MVVNQVAFTAVLVLAKQRQLLVPHVVGLRMLNAIVSVCYGVFLAASYAWVPWTAVRSFDTDPIVIDGRPGDLPET